MGKHSAAQRFEVGGKLRVCHAFAIAGDSFNLSLNINAASFFKTSCNICCRFARILKRKTPPLDGILPYITKIIC